MASAEQSTEAEFKTAAVLSVGTPKISPRYARKKQAIVAAASTILNREGLKGMTFADVAASVGLITTSVTYYFRKKEDLALACLVDSIERFEHLIGAAREARSFEQRIFKLLGEYLARNRRVRCGEEPPPASLSEIRALEGPHRDHMRAAFIGLFAQARSLFDVPELQWLAPRDRDARTHMLLEQLFWSVTWLPRYDLEDYDRIRDRMADILLRGLAGSNMRWNPSPLHIDPSAGSNDASSATFLLAATRLINLQGYRGASVEKISAELNVTKGSFYHHNQNKDELVVACFTRSFEVIKQAQRAAMMLQGTYWDRLASVSAALIDFQLSAHGPLLRASALGAIPFDIRQNMLSGSDRVSDRFAALISDGIAEQSIRAVDAQIASQMLNAALNAAADLTWAMPDIQRNDAPALYVKPMLMGLVAK